MKEPIVVPLDLLIQEPYASVLCFPNCDATESHSRIEELRGHGVDSLEFWGHASLFGVPCPVLGKGFVGVVVIAHLNGEKIAIKIRRTDADRADLLHEASMLAKANEAQVGPRYIGASKNFLLMQLIDGDLLPDWLKINEDPSRVKAVLCQVLEQCFRLDETCLDHGELSKAPKHVIVDGQLEPWIVDFETASDARKPANVSSMCHFLFNSAGEVARTIAEKLNKQNKAEIIESLKVYKRIKTRESFEAVLRSCLD